MAQSKTGRFLNNNTSQGPADTQSVGGVLGWVERRGNQLPDPVFLFFWFILFLIVVSVFASLTGVSAAHPTEIDPATGSQRIIYATSLL